MLIIKKTMRILVISLYLIIIQLHLIIEWLNDYIYTNINLFIRCNFTNDRKCNSCLKWLNIQEKNFFLKCWRKCTDHLSPGWSSFKIICFHEKTCWRPYEYCRGTSLHLTKFQIMIHFNETRLLHFVENFISLQSLNSF